MPEICPNININENLSKAQQDKFKTMLNDASKSSEDSKNNKNFNNTVDVIMQTSARVTKQKQFIDSRKNSETLVTTALKKLQTKAQLNSKEKPVQFISITNEISHGTDISDKPLLVTEPLKKVKHIYTILNNDQINNLRKYAQEAVRQNKVFTIRGNYNSVRHALKTRGWVEKIEMNRKSTPFASSQLNVFDASQVLSKRKTGETHRQCIAKMERSIMSRYVENVLCDFLWTQYKGKADNVDQSKNPNMLINKFNRAPFTNKENLNVFLRDISAFYEKEVADIKFPRCFNVWSPEELSEFVDNFKLTACIAFIHCLVDKYNGGGFDSVFSPTGKIPFNSIDFAFKRCLAYIDVCQHNDIDVENPPCIWEHDWDTFLNQHYQLTHNDFKILVDPQKMVEAIITRGSHILENIHCYWPQESIDGFQNLWIIKPANKCRGRGIQLSNNLKKIINFVNPSIAKKCRFVVQKYMERPLLIHQTKFDIRQWFLISNIHPLLIWMYKECYLRFSTQEFTLASHHESVHLTNHAIQKKYTNNIKRDTRLPHENMWDSYSFQAYLRQIGRHEFWLERIYPGMRKAIVAAVLVSQDHMERTYNTFELFGADFMICENFYPWLIEINSNPDLAATTSVTARMCPQFLEDVIKVMIDRRNDIKADVGNFELIYRQNIPPAPAYMGLNIIVKGKKIACRLSGHQSYFGYQRKENLLHTSLFFKQRTSLAVTNLSQVHKPMPAFNATKYIEKSMAEVTIKPRSKSVSSLSSINEKKTYMTHFIPRKKEKKPCYNLMIPAVGNNQSKIFSPKSPLCSPLKRYRSCGPRLSNNCLANSKDIQKSKLFVGCIKTNLLDSYILARNKSADNIKGLYSPFRKTMKCTKTLSPIIPANKNLRNSKKQFSLRHKMKSDNDEINVKTIHAIGRGYASDIITHN